MAEHCDEALHALHTYLDGECGPSLGAAIRAHLEACPPCMGRADFEREVRRIVAEKCKDAAPSGLIERVLSSLRTNPPT